ncbi:MAG: hypothetical protein GY754_19860 [bacterium]|nr:hypothetical protein [bacterium]
MKLFLKLFFRMISIIAIMLTALACSDSGFDNDPRSGDGDYRAPWNNTQLLGTETNDETQDIAVDSNGNVYVTGFTSAALDGSEHKGAQDIFLTKYDSSGSKQWTRQTGSSNNDIPCAIAIDSNDNIYITGYTDGDMAGSSGGYDSFLVKYDPSGELQWTRQDGTSYSDYPKAITIDSINNIYICGYTTGAFSGSNDDHYGDIFIIKYDSLGGRGIGQQLTNATRETVLGAGVDSEGNLYITGYTGGSLKSQPNQGGNDIFLVKYNPSLEYQWTRQIGTADNEGGYDLTVSPKDSIYISGYIGESLDGSEDAVLIKYSSEGILQWTRRLETTADDDERAFGVAADSDDTVYITGYTHGSLDSHTSAGDSDIFLVRYSSRGEKLWSRQLGTDAQDRANDIALDDRGNIFITGFTYGSLDGNIKTGDSSNSDSFICGYDSSGELL